MDLYKCLHPKRVFNKYLNEYVWVDCRECEACKKRRAAAWVSRLERERANSLFTFFVTLTYDNSHLPTLTLSTDLTRFYDILHPDKSIPFDTIQSVIRNDKPSYDYVYKRLQIDGLPYCRIEDIQLFHKRLNKYIHDNSTSSYQNFRYFTVCEIGSTTFRPHFHSLYFVNSEQVAKVFEESIYKTWQNGHIDFASVERSASSYVAQYVNKLGVYPNVYKIREIAPFYTFSRRPSIGNIGECTEDDDKEVFENGKPFRIERNFASDTHLSNVPLLPCIKIRIFPKLRAFDQISHSLRVALYGCFERYRWKTINFTGFYWSVYKKCQYELNNHCLSEFSEYILKCCDFFRSKVGFSDLFADKTSRNFLRRLYYVSRRVLLNCVRFKVSLDYYVSKIEKFWSDAELSLLSEWYRLQSVQKDPEQLIFQYPEFAYKNESCLVYKLDECPTFVSFKNDMVSKLTKSTLTHFKNAYLDSLKIKNLPIYSLIKDFLYAKKCHEIIEVCAESKSAWLRFIAPSFDDCELRRIASCDVY